MKEIPWGVTPRRLSAAKRALQKQRDKAPLFAAEIASGQPSPEERIYRFDAANHLRMREDRKRDATMWRKGRAILRAMTMQEREVFLAYWNERWKGPKRPEYLLDLLHTWKA